jgi:CTP synthase (UTP-ammonia lyase)
MAQDRGMRKKGIAFCEIGGYGGSQNKKQFLNALITSLGDITYEEFLPAHVALLTYGHRHSFYRASRLAQRDVRSTRARGQHKDISTSKALEGVAELRCRERACMWWGIARLFL